MVNFTRPYDRMLYKQGANQSDMPNAEHQKQVAEQINSEYKDTYPINDLA